jgi:hypothetical protein
MALVGASDPACEGAEGPKPGMTTLPGLGDTVTTAGAVPRANWGRAARKARDIGGHGCGVPSAGRAARVRKAQVGQGARHDSGGEAQVGQLVLLVLGKADELEDHLMHTD